MRSIIFILFIGLFVLPALAQESVEFDEKIELDIPQLENPVTIYGRQPFFLNLDKDSPNQLLIYISTYGNESYVFNNNASPWWYTAWYMKRLDTQSGESTINEGNEGLFSNAVPIEDGKPLLEGFSVSLVDIEYVLDGDGVNSGLRKQHEYFDLALLSPTGKYLAGIVEFHLEDYGGSDWWDTMRIWQADTSKQIFVSGPFVDVFEIQFTSSENYIYGRGMGYHEEKEFVGDGEFRTILSAVMIDMENGETVEAHSDVAFTSDERYFVTERDEKPTLVHTETNQNILQYNMPVRMVGATFSPDDQTLYLTGKDNSLYVFNSNLPTNVSDWMLQ